MGSLKSGWCLGHLDCEHCPYQFSYGTCPCECHNNQSDQKRR